ncbi:MAG TPA: alanine--tRNA ligase-related protein [Spirochaetia bacterium]|nr:alanine--tRNA ligase-related protein [Spirochaetia bacterium]
MTESLFYTDPYITEFEASIVRTEELENETAIVLDRTFFYPEGGGQPADLGSIADVAVLDVRKRGGEILHIVPALSGSTRAGTRVKARVDGARRHDYMQQHTGQHIVSAALLAAGNFNTVSVHQGDAYTTIEVDRDGITPEDITLVETLANRIIREHRAVTDKWVPAEEVHRYPLRRPPKVSGTIRLVMIDDFDCVACGGVHARNTGEVGLVKCIGVEKIRSHARTIWKIGDRAYEDYRRKHETVSMLVQELSAQPEEIVERVRQQIVQQIDVRREITELRARLARQLAGSLYDAGSNPDAANRMSGMRIVTHRMEAEDKELFRGVVDRLTELESCHFCIVNVTGDQLQWAIGGSKGNEPGALEFSQVREKLLPLIDGKGGGRPPVFQGAGKSPDRVEEFFAAFREIAVGRNQSIGHPDR